MALDFMQVIEDHVDALNPPWTGAKKLQMLVDFTNEYQYQEMVPGPLNPEVMIPNPVNRRTFANQVVARLIRQAVGAYRIREAQSAIIVEELDLE